MSKIGIDEEEIGTDETIETVQRWKGGKMRAWKSLGFLFNLQYWILNYAFCIWGFIMQKPVYYSNQGVQIEKRKEVGRI